MAKPPRPPKADKGSLVPSQSSKDLLTSNDLFYEQVSPDSSTGNAHLPIPIIPQKQLEASIKKKKLI